MNRLSTNQVRVLSAWIIAISISGCATNPNVRYNEICDVIPENGIEKDPRPSSRQDWYADGTAAKDVAMARGYLEKYRSHYALYECQKENENRKFDHALIGSAIAVAGAGIAKANSYVLEGLGLTAGGISAVKTYEQPATDREAFMNAYAQLTCVYDETHALSQAFDIDRLAYERVSLQLVIAELNADQRNAATPKNPSTQDTLYSDAVKDALTAGNKAVERISSTLSAYGDMPRVLYKTTDDIDVAARRANESVNGSFSSFLDSIKDSEKAAAQDAVKTDDSKSAADNAQASHKAAKTAKDIENKGKTPLPGKSNSLSDLVEKHKAIKGPDENQFQSVCSKPESSAGADASAKENASTAAASDAGDSKTPDADKTAAKADSDKSGTGCDHMEHVAISKGNGVRSRTNSGIPDSGDLRASAVLADDSTGDLEKLLRLVDVVNDDLPSPSYSRVRANVAACTVAKK